MTDWKTRHDIDQIKWASDELSRLFEANGVSTFRELFSKYYDQSVIDEKTSKLDLDLTSLRGNLNNLDGSLDALTGYLIDFNGELIDLNDDNTHLATDLYQLKDNLLMLLDALGLLDVDLTQLQSSLIELDEQINGDGTSDGFVDVLQAIQYSIYGEPPYTSDNPSPSSLKGMLNTFGNQLDNVIAGDNKLSLSLSTLSGYLETFKGSLSELEAQIIADYGQSTYDGLDTDLIKVIGAITEANDELDTHMGLIEDVNDTIGSSGDTLSDGTLYGVLNNTSDVASATSTQATNLQKTLYSGANGSGTTSNPANNTVMKNLNTVKDTDIPNVKNKMGFNDIPQNTTLQGQIDDAVDSVDTINNTTIPNLSESINTVDGKIDGVGDRIDAVDGKVDDVNTIIGDTSQVSGSIVQNITGIKTDIGNTSSIDGSIVSNINNVLNDISDVQSDIGDMSQLSNDLASSISDTQSNIGVVQENIDVVQSDITDIQTDVGNVDVEVNSDLQTQILNIVGMLKDMFVAVAEVDSITSVTEDTMTISVDGVVTTYYIIPSDYPYEIIHTRDTDEYFTKGKVTIENVEFDVWEWVLNPFLTQFKQTMLYDILSSLFAERSTPIDVLSSWEAQLHNFDRTNILQGSVKFYRQFNIVTCIYQLTTKEFDNTSDQTVFPVNTIPTAYRPSDTFYQDIGDYYGTVKHGLLSVKSTGDMYIRMGTSNTSMNVYGKLTYVIED